MFCPNCGAEYSLGAKFCMNCGQSLDAPESVPVEAPSDPVITVAEPEPVVQEPAPVVEAAPAAPEIEPVTVASEVDPSPVVEPASMFEPVPATPAVEVPISAPEVVEPAPAPASVPFEASYMDAAPTSGSFDSSSTTGAFPMPVEPVFPEEPEQPTVAPTEVIPSAEAYQATTISAPYETPVVPVDATVVRPQAVEAPQPSYYQSAPQSSYDPIPQATSFGQDQSSYQGQSQSYVQPATQQVPTYGTQASYSPQQPSYQQAGYSAPQQPSYQQPSYGSVQQPAPASQKKSPLSSPVMKVILGAAAFAIAFLVGSSLFSGCSSDDPTPSSSGGGSSVPTITVPDVPSTDAPSTDAPSTETPSTPAPSSPSVTIPDEALDAEGNPTVYAVEEMTGSDICAMLESEGWDWSTDNLWYTSSDNNDAFYVMGPNDHEFSLSEIQALAANGSGSAACYTIVVDDRDYSSCSDALSKLTPLVVEHEEWIDDELGIAVAYGPSMVEDLVLVTYIDEPGLYKIEVFNPEACSTGMVDEWLGDDYGRTPEDIFETIFG